jgi:hypothetical protein
MIVGAGMSAVAVSVPGIHAIGCLCCRSMQQQSTLFLHTWVAVFSSGLVQERSVCVTAAESHCCAHGVHLGQY